MLQPAPELTPPLHDLPPLDSPAYYLNDLGWRDGWALYQLAREPAFFYAYIKENRQPVWLGVTRFILLALASQLRRPRHWFKALRRTHDHALIGCVVLLDIGKLAPAVGEIAYFTACHARNQGLSRHAVLSVAHWAQARFGLRGLYANVDPENAASQAILHRLGLTATRFVAATHSVFTDRAGQPRPYWVMQSTPQSFAAALTPPPTAPFTATMPPAAYPVFDGQKKPTAQIA